MSPRRLVVGASALALTAALGACAAGEEQREPAVGSPPPSTTSTTPSTTTAPSRPLVSTTTTTPAAIPGGCPSGVGVAAQSAQQAARCLFRAWEEDNRARAAAFASLDVVEALFRERWSAPVGTFDGCASQSGTGGQLCTIDHRGTSYQFDVRRSEGGWRVTQLRR
ncbi:MAG: hypothetical protein M3450_09605 [Actinomycetota bacterium]|nr:hypothetical protein [Actinomycetota bacterium]